MSRSRTLRDREGLSSHSMRCRYSFIIFATKNILPPSSVAADVPATKRIWGSARGLGSPLTTDFPGSCLTLVQRDCAPHVAGPGDPFPCFFGGYRAPPSRLPVLLYVPPELFRISERVDRNPGRKDDDPFARHSFCLSWEIDHHVLIHLSSFHHCCCRQHLRTSSGLSLISWG